MRESGLLQFLAALVAGTAIAIVAVVWALHALAERR